MPITLGQITGELRDVREWTAQINTATPTISNTKVMSGAYSIRCGNVSNQASVGHLFAAQSGVRCGCWLNHLGVGTGTFAYIFVLRDNGAEVVSVRWYRVTATIELYVNGAQVDSISVASSGMSATDTWTHLGLAYLADNTVTFYVNGLPVLSAPAPVPQINEAFVGGGNFGWANYAYFDDFYIDGDISVDEAPPPDRFLFSLTNAAGSAAQWSPVGAANNYECVDDAVPNNDTDYVIANSAGLIDLHNTANVTLPTDYKVSAVLPVALARAMAAGPTIKLKASDGTNQTTGSAQTMGTSYAYYYDYLPLAPDGAAWNETKINSAQFGYESAGTFS
jgi:hypothetical protein